MKNKIARISDPSHNRKKEVSVDDVRFPEDCENGVMLIFSNYKKQYFVDGMFKINGKISNEESMTFHLSAPKSLIIYQSILNLFERFMFVIGNYYKIHFCEWTKCFGDTFIANLGDRVLTITLYEQTFKIEPRHVVLIEENRY